MSTAAIIAPAQQQSAKSSDSHRMKRLRTLSVDRRASAILQAWSEEKATAEPSTKKTPGDKGTHSGGSPAQAAQPGETDKKAEEKKEPLGETSIGSSAEPAAAPQGDKLPGPDSRGSAGAEQAGKKDDAKNDSAAVTAGSSSKPLTTANEQTSKDDEQKRVKVEAERMQAEIKAIDEELAALQKDVTLGRWDRVKKYLAGIPAAEGKVGYAQMLRSLSAPPLAQMTQARLVARREAAAAVSHVLQLNNAMAMDASRGAAMPEPQVLRLDDIMGLAAACPHKLDDESLTLLGQVVRQAVQSGTVMQEVVAKLKDEAARPAHQAVLNRRQCAQLLAAAGEAASLESFLPSLEQATAEHDGRALKLLAQHFLAVQKDGKPQLLEKAWKAIQAMLALKEGEKKQREEALQMAVDLAPRLRKELGQVWLEQSFAREPERGVKILAAIGSLAATGLQNKPQAADDRLKTLKLQKTAVEALLAGTRDHVDAWQEMLNTIAQSWLREAEFSRVASTSSMYGPRMQRDIYGNFYYVGDESEMAMNARQQEQPQPISASEILKVGPSEAWLEKLHGSVRPRFVAIYAQLYLKVGEEERAYPYIERLAKTHAELAQDLAHEFIRVWTRNHDPNTRRQYSNPYIFMYGYERKADSIPLTRSKQQRNLSELSKWVRRLRALPLKKLDESIFAQAFTTCHSGAEVYRLDAIKEVFGSIDALKPKTLAELAEQMRGNLSRLWRMPAEQEAKKTRRKQKDIEAEVLRGYQVASTVVSDGLKTHPDDWQLHLVQACLLHDENSYRQEVTPNSKFSHKRLEALTQFRKAAELYAKTVPSLEQYEQTTRVFENWLYAGLGASNLEQIDHRSTPDARQPALIRKAIAALPGEAAEKHRGLFANTLFTRISSVKPTVKFRYLKAGFEIVGDHEQAREARKLYDYYSDLVKELELVTRLDGSAKIGHQDPFGVFVELKHTHEIERESGGFGRYLQNQNNMGFSWNYGRPTDNYRDKFEEGVTAALAENFEVLSVTFQEQTVHSRSAPQAGWRLTPYAYVLVKARKPQVDKLPALKMDLDFLDTSGYVMLPIQSPPAPLDAAPSKRDLRPFSKLEVSQTLDERQAGEGKLLVEVKATSRGLVPRLDELLDVRVDRFDVVATSDEGVSVSRFDPDIGEPTVISERTATITYVGRKGLAELPKQFKFPSSKISAAKVNFQRYQDADLATVEQIVSLERNYGETRRPWLWALAACVPCALAVALGYRAWSRRRTPTDEGKLHMPEKLTPFNVLALLHHLHEHDGLKPEDRQKLAGSIATLERYYFAREDGEEPDLQRVAESWLAGRR